MGIDFILYVVLAILVVLISMTFHEAVHAYAGYWLGDDTAKVHGRLSFNPIKHIDPFLTILLPLTLALMGGPVFGAAKPVPFNPQKLRYQEWGPALVAIAGPISNLFLAFVIFGVSVLVGQPVSLSMDVNNLVGLILFLGVVVNLGFCIFNLIPIPPLDGSRLLYALAPEFVRRGMEFMEQFGTIIVLGLVLFAGQGFSNLMFTAIDAFLNLFRMVFGL